MGLRSATVACQRLTGAVCYMYSSHMYSSHMYNILNYLDDFTGVSHPDTALGAYNFIGNVLCDWHLEESVQKAEPPSTSMTIPGIHFDTIPKTMSVTAERLRELSVLLSERAHLTVASKSQLQSMVGKLIFVSKCVLSFYLVSWTF